MKKALLLVLLPALVLGGCSVPFFNRPSEPSTTPVLPDSPELTQNQIEQLPIEIRNDADLLTRIGNTTIWVPESEEWGLKIQMENGNGEVKSGSDQATVALSPPQLVVVTPSLVNSESDTTDAFVVANFNFDGSGNEQYIVLYRDHGPALIQTSDILIGSGVQITNLVKRLHEVDPSSYYVDVVYLDRRPDEPLTTAPTIEKTKQLIIQQHVIQNEDGHMYLLQ